MLRLLRTQRQKKQHLNRALLAIWLVAMLAACSPGRDDSKQIAKPSDQVPSAAASAKPFNKSDPNNYRFLYVVYCTGRVDKLDLQAQTKVASFELSEKSGSPPLIAKLPNPTFGYGSCLAHPVSDARLRDMELGQVRLVATDQLHRNDSDGKQRFRLLTFALPEWNLAASYDLGMINTASSSEPALVVGPGDTLKLAAENAPPRPEDVTDIASYTSDQRLQAETTKLEEWSSDTSLISAVTRTGNAFGFANRAQRTFHALALPPKTPWAWIRSVRLAPGGRFALLHIQKPVANHPVNEPTSATQKSPSPKLILFDANGKIVASFDDPNIARPSDCVAITPNGDAVFSDRKGNYGFVSLGVKFSTELVFNPLTDDMAGAFPGLVYGSK